MGTVKAVSRNSVGGALVSVGTRAVQRGGGRGARIGRPPSGADMHSQYTLRVREETGARTRRGRPSPAGSRESGRGGGTAWRGGSRSVRGHSSGVYDQLTAGWRADSFQPTSLQMEHAFPHNAYSERSRAYGSALLSNVGNVLAARSFPVGTSKYVLMFCGPIIFECVKLAIQTITLRGSADAAITKDNLYRFLAVFIFHMGRV